MAQLRPYPELPIVFVAMEGPQETERFRMKMRSPHRFIADPSRTLYQAFGLRRATLPQIVNRNVTRRLIEAVRAGHAPIKRSGSDPAQLGGTFILGTDGETMWSRVSGDIADNVYAAELRRHLPARQ